jgi:hypothetical protein
VIPLELCGATCRFLGLILTLFLSLSSLHFTLADMKKVMEMDENLRSRLLASCRNGKLSLL